MTEILNSTSAISGATILSNTAGTVSNINYCTNINGVTSCNSNSGDTYFSRANTVMSSGSSFVYEPKVIHKVNGDNMMCEHVFGIGFLLVVGYLIGKGWDWKYKIVQKGESWFDVYFRPAWWPFWIDQGPRYHSLKEAKEGLEIYKNSSVDISTRE